MNTHIDQMKEWWDGAEQSEPDHGDSVIERLPDDEYRVRKWFGCMGSKSPHIRILERAPKPKPAWENSAWAVIARIGEAAGRRVFIPTAEPGIWDDTMTGRGYPSNMLVEAVPLVPAKATGSMVEAARSVAIEEARIYLELSLISRMLTAAFKTETE